MLPMKSVTRQRYLFISLYIGLLALPLVIGLWGMSAQSQLGYRGAVEQRLRSLNHAIAKSENETLKRAELMLALTLAADSSVSLGHSTAKTRQAYNRLWQEQAHLNDQLEMIYFADSTGFWFTSDEELTSSTVDAGYDPTTRSWFKGAAMTPSVTFWGSPYLDAFNDKLLLSASLAVVDPLEPGYVRVVGADIDLNKWSELLKERLRGSAVMHHMLVDRRNGTILVHSQSDQNNTRMRDYWQKELHAQSGSFYSGENNEFVAYEALEDWPDWISVTIQARQNLFSSTHGQVVAVVLSVSFLLFIFVASRFNARLEELITALSLMIRRLRSGEDVAITSVKPYEITQLGTDLEVAAAQLHQSHVQASRDGLTGLYNRRYFDEMLVRLETQSSSFVLALIDLDHFKSINDTYGHGVGDGVLRRVAVKGQEVLGESAALCRFGGEELVAIFESSSQAEAEQRLEAWRIEVAGLKWWEDGLTVTFSAGVGSRGENSCEALFVAVDQALYRAKQNGRNRLYRI